MQIIAYFHNFLKMVIAQGVKWKRDIRNVLNIKKKLEIIKHDEIRNYCSLGGLAKDSLYFFSSFKTLIHAQHPHIPQPPL